MGGGDKKVGGLDNVLSPDGSRTTRAAEGSGTDYDPHCQPLHLKDTCAIEQWDTIQEVALKSAFVKKASERHRNTHAQHE